MTGRLPAPLVLRALLLAGAAGLAAACGPKRVEAPTQAMAAVRPPGPPARAAAPELSAPSPLPVPPERAASEPGGSVGSLEAPRPLPVTPPAATLRRHRVAPGQTLYRIALLYRVTPEQLARANGLKDARQLRAGQELVVPERPPGPVGAGGPTAPAGTGPLASSAQASAAPRGGARASSGAERVSAGTPLTAGLVQLAPPERPAAEPGPPVAPRPAPRPEAASSDRPLQWPLKGVLYARFGKKGGEPHEGIDLAAPLGTHVKAAADGRVLFAGEQRGYGRLLILEHAGDLVTLYAHNQVLKVRAGQRVRSGDVVATVGESGRTSGPHLHFEVRRRGSPVDPLGLLVPARSASGRR